MKFFTVAIATFAAVVVAHDDKTQINGDNGGVGGAGGNSGNGGDGLLIGGSSGNAGDGGNAGGSNSHNLDVDLEKLDRNGLISVIQNLLS